MNWWGVLFLPILLRALIPVGFMPAIGPDFSIRLAMCDGDGPMVVSASTPMAMDMPAGMSMDPADLSGGPAHDPGRQDHGSCPYGSAPALGALPALATLPPLLLARSRELILAAAQVAYVEISPRAQSPRGPPV